MFEALAFGFSQGFVVGPLTLYGIREGLNPKKGFFYQAQVILGSAFVDIFYVTLSAYGVAQIIDNSFVRLFMWFIGAYMLIIMGVNTFHERRSKISFHHMHRHRVKFLETDFFRGIVISLVNPLAIVFWIMVVGSLYGEFRDKLSPLNFATLIAVGSLTAAFIIAFLTLFLRKIFHQGVLKKFTAFGSIILIGYGVWFFFKAVMEAKLLSLSLWS